MTDASYRDRALADLTDADVERMLEEDESLFVEHKAGLGQDEAFQLVKAVASFANQLGGWVLLGVTKGKPNEGWDPDRGELVDRVRQSLDGQIDPLPTFTTGVRRAHGKRVGVVRVHESADTPHITRSGAIYVREPAQDKEHERRRYRPVGVASQLLLRDLAQRGTASRERTESLFRPRALALVDHALGFRYDFGRDGQLIPTAVEPRVALRLAPLTLTPRFRDWALSESGKDACKRIARELAGHELDGDERVGPHANGVAATARRPQAVVPGGGDNPWLTVSWTATAVLDAAGVIGAGLEYTTPRHPPWVTLAGFREFFLDPPLRAIASALEDNEFLGRFACHVWLSRLSRVVGMTADGRNSERGPADLPTGGELTLPTDEETLAALAERWTATVARSRGLHVWG